MAPLITPPTYGTLPVGTLFRLRDEADQRLYGKLGDFAAIRLSDGVRLSLPDRAIVTIVLPLRPSERAQGRQPYGSLSAYDGGQVTVHSDGQEEIAA